MRLPARSRRQTDTENLRQIHEELYAAFLDGDICPVFITVKPDEDLEEKQQRISGNMKRFWQSRGFKLITRQSREPRGVSVWIEKRASDDQSKVA